MSVHLANLKATAIYGAPENPEFANSDGWTVTLRYQGRRMSTPFYLGSGHDGREPEAAEVMEALLSDAASIENAPSFEEWCAELGFEEDSRRAERIYKATQRQTEKLRRLLGDDYQRALWAGDDEDRRCSRCGDTVQTLSTDNLCDGCVAEDS